MIERPLYLDKIMPFVDTPFVKILTRVRRCGKSIILKMIIKKIKKEKNVDDEQILNYRFDSMEYEDMTTKELYLELKSKIIQSKKTYLFLDEIQEIEGWEKVVNTLASDFDVDIYITGSNSRMMSSEISTYLTVRYITFHIYTLSFEEYLMFKKSYTTLKELKQEFSQYVRLGGFPATHLQDYSQDEVYTIVKDIYNSTIFSDIVRRNQVKKIDQLERVVKYTFNNIRNTFSAKSISNYFKSEQRKIDNETVCSYLEKLQKAYILHKCSRYDLQGKNILKTQEKFYLADVSLRYSALGYAVDSIASSLENIVYLELKRRGYDVYISKIKDKEIDFVATKQNEKIYVQVTQEIKSEKTQKREYEQLLEIRDNYPKYVVMADDFAGGKCETKINQNV
jgi:predicted AAA+ superfamily ATPase